MELDALARRDPESVVAMRRGQIVEDTPLVRSHHPAGNSPPDHHDELLACLPYVAVVLLIDAVEFKELRVVIAKSVRACIGQSRADGSGQRGDGFLNGFVMRRLR